MKKRELYREEDIDDRTVLFTGYIANARTILVKVPTKVKELIASIIPKERKHVVCTMNNVV